MSKAAERDKLAAKILRDVPPSRIIAAAGLLAKHHAASLSETDWRRRYFAILRHRAGASDDTPYSPAIEDIEAFIASLDVRQLRLLRKLARPLALTARDLSEARRSRSRERSRQAVQRDVRQKHGGTVSGPGR